MKKTIFILTLTLFYFFIQSCNFDSASSKAPSKNKPFCDGLCFSTDFESGSIGTISKISENQWSLSLKNDNDNPALPSTFRTWWYVKVDNITSKGAQLQFTGLGFKYYFVPVFSLNGKDWQHFPEESVKKINDTTIEITVPGEHSTMWIARTFPYTTKNYLTYLTTIRSSPYVSITSLGHSPYKKFSIDLLTITDQQVRDNKKTVWIHARTHAAEVGSSYLLEGLINTILGNNDLGNKLRQKYIFKIVPMHNPDGIILGNYRTNASSINLENQWLFDKNSPNPIFLMNTAPIENRYLNTGAMASLITDENAPVILALNLHSSNSKPDTPAFFFPHFGPAASYTENEQKLWHDQLNFIYAVGRHYNGRIEAPPTEGGKGFLNSYFPETWWWYNKQNQINAITLETTYSKAGYDYWITPKEWRDLGIAVANAISEFDSDANTRRSRSTIILKNTMSIEELQEMELNH